MHCAKLLFGQNPLPSRSTDHEHKKKEEEKRSVDELSSPRCDSTKFDQ